MAVIRDMIPAFELFQPTSVDDAIDLLDRYGEDGWVLSGGLDSFDWFKDRIKRPAAVVDLVNLDELRGVRSTGDGVEIGAMTTITNVATNPELMSSYSVLTDAAAGVATPQIRNRGTLGGNLSQDTRCWYYRGGWPCYPGRRQHVLRVGAHGHEPRALHHGLESLRCGEPFGYGSRSHRSGCPVRDPGSQGRARRRCRGLLHAAQRRHRAHDGPEARRAVDRDTAACPVGGGPVLLREVGGPQGVGLRSGDGGLGHAYEWRRDRESAPVRERSRSLSSPGWRRRNR